MSMFADKRETQSASGRVAAVLGSPAVQLGGGVVFAVVLPILLSLQQPWSWFNDPGQLNATIGSLLALLTAAYMVKQFASFPGIREDLYVVPAFTVTYGAVLAVLVFARLDYSRTYLIESYVIAVVWYLAAVSSGEKSRRKRLAIVPGGKAVELAAIPAADWVFIDRPELPGLDCSAIVADLRAEHSNEWLRFISDCAVSGLPVYHYKQVYESLTGRVEIEHLSENNLGSLVPDFVYLRLKWLIDALLAIVVLLLIWPLLLIIALAIKLDSPGPVLFRQNRTGFRGRPFVVYKFRTMVVAAADGDQLQQAITKGDDWRVTKVGRFLRRARLDELAQVLNILRGEMSWIGPRPEAEVLSQWYEDTIPFYRYRHIVRPGITGWAQVNQGHVTAVSDVRAKLHYDFFYIRNLSPWLDLLIGMRTLVTMWSGFGAR